MTSTSPLLAQAITKGLLTGMVYGLMALGLSVIFGVMRVVNFAHGELMVVGMYLAWVAFEYLQVSPLLSLPVIAVLFFGAGLRPAARADLSPSSAGPSISSSCCCWAIAIGAGQCLPRHRRPRSRAASRWRRSSTPTSSGPLVFDAVRLHAAHGCCRDRRPALAVLHPHAHRQVDPRRRRQPHGRAGRRPRRAAALRLSPSASVRPAWARPVR